MNFDEMDTLKDIIIIGITLLFICSILYITFSSTKPVPLSDVPQSITKSAVLNANGGILTMSITFSDPQYVNNTESLSNTAIKYEKYTINSVSLTLVNGTTITPAHNFVKQEVEIFCANKYNGLESYASTLGRMTPIEYNCG